MPRVVLGMLVGAALGASGALMQGLTCNPLADPAIFGINGGASLALLLALLFFHLDAGLAYVAVAMAGAASAIAVVYGLARLCTRVNAEASLAIVGAAAGGVLSSLGTVLLLLNGRDLGVVRYWLVGSLNGRDWPVVLTVLPIVLAGLGLALTLGQRLNALSLGEGIAASLGAKPGGTRALGTAAILLLCSSAVASAGPIGFVGLFATHFVRLVVGPDYRRLLPAAAFAGAVFLPLCDLFARSVLVQSYDEIPVGLVTAVLGAPMLWLALRKRLAAA